MRKVILSKRASGKLDKLLEYLEREWSLKAKKDFINKLDRSLKQIQKYPESSIKTNHVIGIHMFVITKHTSIFYKFDAKSILIVTLFDNRMDPEKLKKEIE